jgi:hypothetical protein
MKAKLVLFAALALAGCRSDDNYDPTVPTEMELLSGDQQFGDAGQTLPEPLSVVVLNLEGDPVEGVEVEWFIVNGGGSLSSDVTSSDANGIARVTFRLGNLVGQQRAQAVNSVLSGSPVTFVGNARPGGGGGGGGAARAE